MIRATVLRGEPRGLLDPIEARRLAFGACDPFKGDAFRDFGKLSKCSLAYVWAASARAVAGGHQGLDFVPFGP